MMHKSSSLCTKVLCSISYHTLPRVTITVYKRSVRAEYILAFLHRVSRARSSSFRDNKSTCHASLFATSWLIRGAEARQCPGFTGMLYRTCQNNSAKRQEQTGPCWRQLLEWNSMPAFPSKGTCTQKTLPKSSVLTCGSSMTALVSLPHVVSVLADAPSPAGINRSLLNT